MPAGWADDPVVRRRAAFAPVYGEVPEDEPPRWRTIADEYEAAGDPAAAAAAWERFGGRAFWVCRSRPAGRRLGVTPRIYGERLADLHAAAGRPRRAARVRDMVRRLAAPDRPGV